MFIAALLTIAKIWKQPNHPSMDEGICKMWEEGACNGTLVRRKNILPFTTTQMNLDIFC